MTQLYLFAAAVGVPLVVYFVLTGGDEGGGSDDGVGGVMLRALPLSTLAFVAATFGVAGLALELTGAGSGTTLVAAALAGAVAGAVNSTAFAYLRRSESGADVRDDELPGSTGRVVLAIAPGGRGRVSITVAGQQRYLSARSLPDAPAELPAGAPVLVVDVEGGVARVAPLDPELS